MGIHDRDYYRESAGGMFDAWGRTAVTVWLIVVSCVVFLAQMVFRDVNGDQGARFPVEEFAVYQFDRVLRGEVWRLLTANFLGIGVIVLACNMLTLYWAGHRLEDRYGGREFLLFFLVAGVFSYTAYFLTQIAGLVPQQGVAFGPSPVIIAILVLFACHYPSERILLIVIPVPAWLVAALYVGFAIMSAGVGNGVPFMAYLAGALFGFLYYRTGWQISSIFPSLPSRSRVRSAPRLRVVRPDSDSDPLDDEPEPVPAGVEAAPRTAEASEEPFEDKVDRVLAKVSKEGQDSLTPEERELLFRASEVYKKRRR